jgi:hypothetical protein
VSRSQNVRTVIAGVVLIAAVALIGIITRNIDPWEAVTAVATSMLVLVAVVAAVVGYNQLMELRQQLRDARGTWRDERRPYLVAEWVPSPAAHVLVDLVIRNIGQTPAKKVTVEWDDVPTRVNETVRGSFGEAKIFHEQTSMIAPGQELRMYFDNMVERHQYEQQSGEVLPTRHSVTLHYEDRWGDGYDEQFELDLGLRRGMRAVSVKSVHDLAKEVEELRKFFQKSAINEKPLQVVTESRSDRIHRVRENERQWGGGATWCAGGSTTATR